jgi:uroporphyrin-III C-methyltransferase/precorrin-2 dehydrogenase/sirohydrochlorin ferrochelatase
MTRLNTFPLSLKVRGRSIVIIGGGTEALNKARLAVKTTAQVVIVSPEIDPALRALPVELRERGFEARDLDGAAILFVAGEGGDGVLAAAEARRRGIPVNVVDMPDACDFYTPSIVERAPLTVAISSEGEAPVLARQVRAQIEALLAPGLGRLAALAGRMRKRVEALLPAGPARRRYYEALLTSETAADAAVRGEESGLVEGEALLAAHAAETVSRGTVWLVGAGPGAADLLTLRAQRVLQQADVIVHDQLVPEAVIEMGRRDAERICVGKAKGHHSFSQAQINTLIVRLAREGRTVARLKSGDPMVFGRAGEEIAALREAGLRYEIVPGVSAALAAAADTATPVTLRKVSTGFVLATAHGADDGELQHWVALVGSGLSLALYMGKSIAAETAGRLVAQGAPADLPVGIVVNAGRPDRHAVRLTLGTLARSVPDMPDGPAVLLVGAAIAHGDWIDAAAAASAEFRAA